MKGSVIPQRSDFLPKNLLHKKAEEIRCHKQTGRPLGTDNFIARLEKTLGHILHRHKHGQKGPQKKNGNLQN